MTNLFIYTYWKSIAQQIRLWGAMLLATVVLLSTTLPAYGQETIFMGFDKSDSDREAIILADAATSHLETSVQKVSKHVWVWDGGTKQYTWDEETGNLNYATAKMSSSMNWYTGEGQVSCGTNAQGDDWEEAQLEAIGDSWAAKMFLMELVGKMKTQQVLLTYQGIEYYTQGQAVYQLIMNELDVEGLIVNKYLIEIDAADLSILQVRAYKSLDGELITVPVYQDDSKFNGNMNEQLFGQESTLFE